MSIQLNGTLGQPSAQSPTRAFLGAPLKGPGSITLPRQSASPSPHVGTHSIGIRSSSPTVMTGKAVPVVGPTGTPASETRHIPTAVPSMQPTPISAGASLTSAGNSITIGAAPDIRPGAPNILTTSGGSGTGVDNVDRERSRSLLRIAGPVSPAVHPRSVSADLLTTSGRLIAENIRNDSRQEEGANTQGLRMSPSSPPQPQSSPQFTPRASLPPCRTRQGLADLMKDAMVEAKRQVLTDVDARVTKVMEDVKSLCGEIVCEKVREELDSERRKTQVMIAAFQKELEDQKVKERANTTTTLQTLEELAKSSSATNLQLQAELERMQARSDLARRDAERLGNDLNELRSWCFNRGPDQFKSESGANAVSAGSLQELQEETRLDHMKTKKCISELVCGIEEVAQALASKDQILNKKMEALSAEVQQLSGGSVQGAKPAPGPSPGSRTCSQAAWPLCTVKETEQEGDSPVLQPASWEQEFAREIVTMRMQLEYLQGDVSELRSFSAKAPQPAGYSSAGSTPAGSFAPAREEEPGTAQEGQDKEQDKESNANLDTSAISGISEGNAEATSTSLNALTDDVQLLRAQLEERLLMEREERLASDSSAASRASELAAATGHLSGELTEAKAEVAEALELVHEAVRLGDFLKREVEGERQARQVDIRKLYGRVDNLDKGVRLPPGATVLPFSNGSIGMDNTSAGTSSVPKSDTADSTGPDRLRSTSPRASSSTLPSPHDAFLPRNPLPTPAGEVARVPQLDLSRAIERQNSVEDSKEGSFVSNAPSVLAGGTSTSSQPSTSPISPGSGPSITVGAAATAPAMPAATTGSLNAPLGGIPRQDPRARSPLALASTAPAPPQQRASWTPTRTATLSGNVTSLQAGVQRIPAPAQVVAGQRDRSPMTVMQLRR